MTVSPLIPPAADTGVARSRRKARGLAWLPAIAAGILLLLAGILWWQSSRYSDRYRVHALGRTVEVYSANSRLRVSFVNGIVPNPGDRRHFRQPNAGGRLVVAPLGFGFSVQPDLLEVTLGHWHIFSAALVVFVLALVARESRSSGE